MAVSGLAPFVLSERVKHTVTASLRLEPLRTTGGEELCGFFSSACLANRHRGDSTRIRDRVFANRARNRGPRALEMTHKVWYFEQSAWRERERERKRGSLGSRRRRRTFARRATRTWRRRVSASVRARTLQARFSTRRSVWHSMSNAPPASPNLSLSFSSVRASPLCRRRPLSVVARGPALAPPGCAQRHARARSTAPHDSLDEGQYR